MLYEKVLHIFSNQSFSSIKDLDADDCPEQSAKQCDQNNLIITVTGVIWRQASPFL